jgi:hypothetical protein
LKEVPLPQEQAIQLKKVPLPQSKKQLIHADILKIQPLPLSPSIMSYKGDHPGN